MVRKLAIVAGLGVVLVTGGVASALPSKCDSGITKAAGKKVGCKAGVYAKAQAKDLPPDPAKLAKCESKFSDACAKAKGRADCIVQVKTCAQKEAQADACASAMAASPSGAFLE
jgi:hypothetical protein